MFCIFMLYRSVCCYCCNTYLCFLLLLLLCCFAPTAAAAARCWSRCVLVMLYICCCCCSSCSVLLLYYECNAELLLLRTGGAHPNIRHPLLDRALSMHTYTHHGWLCCTGHIFDSINFTSEGKSCTCIFMILSLRTCLWREILNIYI